MTGGAPDTTSRQLAALAELHRLLGDHDIPYWLFGGWAVDFHAGRITREHADIDIAVWARDHGRLATLLEHRAWAHTPAPDEDGYTSYERGAVRLEVAFLARDDAGREYTPLRRGRGEWPSGTFGTDVLVLVGVSARVIGRRALIADKSSVHDDPDVATKDRADLVSLDQAASER